VSPGNALYRSAKRIKAALFLCALSFRIFFDIEDAERCETTLAVPLFTECFESADKKNPVLLVRLIVAFGMPCPRCEPSFDI